MPTDPAKSMRSGIHDVMSMIMSFELLDGMFKKVRMSSMSLKPVFSSVFENPFAGIRAGLPQKARLWAANLMESINYSFNWALKNKKLGLTGYGPSARKYIPGEGDMEVRAAFALPHKPTSLKEALSSFRYEKVPDVPKYSVGTDGWGKAGSKIINGLLTPFNRVAGTLPRIGGLLASPFVLAGGAMGKMAGVTAKMLGMKPDSLLKVKDGLKELGGSIMSGGMMYLVQILMQLITALNPFQPIIDALITAFEAYGGILEQSFMPLVDVLFAVLMDPAVMKVIELLAQAITQVVISLLPLVYILMPIFTAGLTILTGVFQFISPFIAALSGPLQIVGALFKAISDAMFGLFAIYSETFGEVFVLIAAGFNTVWQIVTGVINIIVGAFTNMIGGIVWVINMAKSGWNAFVDFIKSGINIVIDFLNSGIDSINKMDVLNVIPDIPHIPRLAEGGIITRPTLAILGEAGYNEAVIPLKEGNGGMSRTIQINIYGDVTEEKLFKFQREAWLNTIG